MFNIILSHWATYLLLFWLAVIAVANLWPRKKPGAAPRGGDFHRAGRSPSGMRSRWAVANDKPVEMNE